MNDLVRNMVGQRTRRSYGGCAYCGRPCVGLACRAHNDLPELDPSFLVRKGFPLTTFDSPKGVTTA